MQMQLRPRRRGSAILLASGLFSEWAERVDGLAAGRPLVVVVMQVVWMVWMVCRSLLLTRSSPKPFVVSGRVR